MTRKLERKQLTQAIPVHDVINGGLFGELSIPKNSPASAFMYSTTAQDAADV